MARMVGTIARGVRAPIIRQGDDLAQIVVDSVLEASKEEGFELRNRDVIGITEAVLGRAQGNYATVGQIAQDVRSKVGEGTVGLIFPILSRNRFSLLLQGIASGVDKLIVMLSYPADEVGNHLITEDMLDASGLNPFVDVLDEEGFRKHFGKVLHPFTGVDYVEFYKSLSDNIEIIFANDPRAILKYTDKVITADIHTRKRSKRILKAAGASVVLGLDDIMTESVDGSGFNADYGILGSNKATETSVKLFPKDGQPFVERIQNMLKEKTGKTIEVMVYGDGGFKDPQGGIWELADPVVSPAFTSGLRGTPNELKLKYLADNQFADLNGAEVREALEQAIIEKREKGASLVGKMASEGTTPRQLTDLLGSLCDLTSGSGDKGTPIVLIQGYFDDYASK